MSETSTKVNYKDTLNLPKTDFAMRANLAQNEPQSQKRWEAMDLYARVLDAHRGAARFVFHDGPPYANAGIHVGHLLNKVLKDFVVRTRSMAGFECPYVPGWDCHGLPIEHRVMTELVEKGKHEKLATLPEDARRMAIRRECRAYAEKHVKLQAGQMKRLSTLADYDHPYLTMAPEYEQKVLEVFADLIERGLVYRALKAVHWSIANQTALAEAELEYYDREDPSIYVDFEAADRDAVARAFGVELDETPSFMIWTTTPWTLPANLAIAVHPEFEYALVRLDGSLTVIARELVELVASAGGAEKIEIVAATKGENLARLSYRHPFVEGTPFLREGEGILRHSERGGTARHSERGGTDVYRIVAADYVTLEDGTGLVHTAPGHGEDDYNTGLREGLPIYCPVREDGTFDETTPTWLHGALIWDANDLIIKRLEQSGHMFHHHRFTHSYPHDWRGKSPVIFRATDQWFVNVDRPYSPSGNGAGGDRERDGSLRNRATRAAESEVEFIPEWGRNRMRGMLESRPDWCLSRQRSWGLPIPAFRHSETGEVFMTAASVRAVASVIGEKGSDAWFTESVEELLKQYDAASDPDAPEWVKRTPALREGEGQRTPSLREGEGKSTPSLREGEGPSRHSESGGTSRHSERGGSVVKMYDIFDVWFESGSSWNAVLRARDLGYPADLYLEGSDQHRGWFQLSLLPALGATGQSPFRALLTHGFLVDKDGRKMSKSLGNALEVDTLLKDFGADVCRWWVSSLAYENDIKVDLDFFRTAGESYRKVRNTLRFLLSNLFDFNPGESRIDLQSIEPRSIDAWALAMAGKLNHEVRQAFDQYEFRRAHQSIYDFCNDTMSAVYLAATKDRLYCDPADSPRRRATQTVLHEIAQILIRLLAPILPHTAEEAFSALCAQRVGSSPSPDSSASIHTLLFYDLDFTADGDWPAVLVMRERALKALEEAKAAGVENPLDAGLVVPDPDGALARFVAVDLADLCGVSRFEPDPAAGSIAVNDLRNEPRCERSWKRDGTVKPRSSGAILCNRCAAAIGA